ncbi:MAG TPA: hypothetical protein VEK35_03685, partial [Roseiarcus sp.]|nr:hypothetical protein [Roseiarcus sp.]
FWASSASVIDALFPAGEQARAASLQIVLIGVALCAVLLFRPRGLLGERQVVSRHLDDLSPVAPAPGAETASGLGNENRDADETEAR